MKEAMRGLVDALVRRLEARVLVEIARDPEEFARLLRDPTLGRASDRVPAHQRRPRDLGGWGAVKVGGRVSVKDVAV